MYYLIIFIILVPKNLGLCVDRGRNWNFKALIKFVILGCK